MGVQQKIDSYCEGSNHIEINVDIGRDKLDSIGARTFFEKEEFSEIAI